MPFVLYKLKLKLSLFKHTQLIASILKTLKEYCVTHQAKLYPRLLEMIGPEQQTFTIKEVSQHLGLSKSTLRFWEKEFGTCIRPQRTAGGQRRYNVNNINLFEIIHNLKQQGLKLSDIKNQLSLRQFCNEGLDSTMVDQLANRIAEAVRKEIIIFFRKEA